MIPDGLPAHGGVTRRTFLRTGMMAAAALGAGCTRSPAQPLGPDGVRLRARPRTPARHLAPGEYDLVGPAGVEGTLFVPAGYRADVPAPLFIILHGAGASRNQIHLFFPHADPHGIVMLAPKSEARTWDMIAGGFGPDVVALNRALDYTFGNCGIDPARVTLGGFSDGGSYALSLGLANGDLFSRLVGFSAGFLTPPERVGRPAVFLSHGTADAVLPIDATGRVIRQRLQAWDYEVTWREFEGPHTVPLAIAQEAFAWMNARP